MELATTILVAFGGGVFGSLIGGTTAFIFTGLLGLVGIAVSLCGGGDVILNQVAFGPFFGPHVAFVGAVAAAGWAGRRRVPEREDAALEASDMHEVMSGGAKQKDIAEFINGADTTIPLFRTQDPVILLVGGLFGVFGFFFQKLIVDLGVPIDATALTVLVFGILTRLLLGKSGLTGIYPAGEKRFGFKPVNITFVALWSFSVSAVVSSMVIQLGMNNIGFAISAFSLIFLYFKLKFPVSHHITMVAGYAALAFGNVWLGALFGMLAAIAGGFITRGINTHVDTHWDMPATVIAPFSMIIFLLSGTF